MNDDQSLRIAVAFAREAAKSPEARLCSACVDVLDVTGAGITIMGGGQAGPVCVSNPRMAALEDLQYTIGEGPCQDAFRSNTFVHAPRLDVSASARWPSFVDLAHATGVGAVFAYPLSAKGAKIGVLTLYQDDEGELSAMQHDGQHRHGRGPDRDGPEPAGRRARRHARRRSRRRGGVSGRDPSGVGDGVGSVADPGRRGARCGSAPTPSPMADRWERSPQTSSPGGCVSPTIATICQASRRIRRQ